MIAEASELTKSKSNVMAASVSIASDFNRQHVQLRAPEHAVTNMPFEVAQVQQTPAVNNQITMNRKTSLCSNMFHDVDHRNLFDDIS